MMIVEQSVLWLEGETEVLGENLLQCHFVHHKSHMTREFVLPLCELIPPDGVVLTTQILIELDTSGQWRKDILILLQFYHKILTCGACSELWQVVETICYGQES
jgi:hypothetical protein